jgi:Raf kinase inhibitor-like YbhB/YbcL family protein
MVIRTLALAALAATALNTSAVAQTRRPPPAQIMPMTSSAWKDGGVIPPKYAQPGDDVSPPLAWDNVPEGVESFVLIMRDLDGIALSGADTHLYWMLWNIPKDARSVPEGVPEIEELPNGTRQISVSGPWYRGPAAPPSSPPHHYAFELYALNAKLDIPAVGQSPAATEAAVKAAMEGKILGKGTFVGLFKRN